jgi:hypothetical protein
VVDHIDTVGVDVQGGSDYRFRHGGFTHTALSIQGKDAAGVTCHGGECGEVGCVVNDWIIHIQFQLVLVGVGCE